jgi:hypothetical protein
MIRSEQFHPGIWVPFDQLRQVKVDDESLQIYRQQPDRFKGIELAEEVLQRAGFSVGDQGYVKDDFRVVLSGHGFAAQGGVLIAYIHELQNLWQDKTGKYLHVPPAVIAT